eukprot:UC1_evm1s1010
MVANVFHNVASRYDLMNDAMSAGVHRLWKDQFVRMLAPTSATRLLDVAGGTGDIALRALEASRQIHSGIVSGSAEGGGGRITVCDINPSMVEQGKLRAESLGLKG